MPDWLVVLLLAVGAVVGGAGFAWAVAWGDAQFCLAWFEATGRPC